MKPFYKLIISVILPVMVGWASSYFTATSVKTWFVTLKKPFFNPPSWLFAPVWTILYILMGIAFFLIWKNNIASYDLKKRAIAFYCLTFIKLFLVGYFLLCPATRMGFCRDFGFTAYDNCNHFLFLQNIKNCRLAYGTLHFMGMFRHAA